MALIKCPECSRDISARASTCPLCGAPLRRASRNICKGLIVVGALIAVIAAAFVWRAVYGPHPNFDTASAEWSFIAGLLLLIVGWWNRA